MNTATRRQFLQSTAIGAVALTQFPALIRAAEPDRKIKLGLIGCGWYGMVDLKAALKCGGVEVNPRNRAQDYGLQPAPWDSPRKTTDSTPYSVLMADLIEKGTDGADGVVNITSAPHTPNGRRVSGSNQLVEPGVLGSEGGNVASVDGSVAWRRQRVMHPHVVVWFPDGGQNDKYIGYW